MAVEELCQTLLPLPEHFAQLELLVHMGVEKKQGLGDVGGIGRIGMVKGRVQVRAAIQAASKGGELSCRCIQHGRAKGQTSMVKASDCLGPLCVVEVHAGERSQAMSSLHIKLEQGRLLG